MKRASPGRRRRRESASAAALAWARAGRRGRAPCPRLPRPGLRARSPRPTGPGPRPGATSFAPTRGRAPRRTRGSSSGDAAGLGAVRRGDRGRRRAGELPRAASARRRAAARSRARRAGSPAGASRPTSAASASHQPALRAAAFCGLASARARPGRSAPARRSRSTSSNWTCTRSGLLRCPARSPMSRTTIQRRLVSKACSNCLNRG